MNYIMYPLGLLKLSKADIDLETDDIRMAAITSGYVYNAAHEFMDSLTVDVATGAGARQAVDLTASLNDDIVGFALSSATVEFPTITGTVKYLAIYKYVSTDADSPLIGLIDFDTSTKVCGGSKLTVTFSGDFMEIM
jgi:hypothetical protein